jgi:hypothetical protein
LGRHLGIYDAREVLKAWDNGKVECATTPQCHVLRDERLTIACSQQSDSFATARGRGDRRGYDGDGVSQVRIHFKWR